jgi:hypothetical protein
VHKVHALCGGQAEAPRHFSGVLESKTLPEFAGRQGFGGA